MGATVGSDSSFNSITGTISGTVTVPLL